MGRNRGLDGGTDVSAKRNRRRVGSGGLVPTGRGECGRCRGESRRCRSRFSCHQPNESPDTLRLRVRFSAYDFPVKSFRTHPLRNPPMSRTQDTLPGRFPCQDPTLPVSIHLSGGGGRCVSSSPEDTSLPASLPYAPSRRVVWTRGRVPVSRGVSPQTRRNRGPRPPHI